MSALASRLLFVLVLIATASCRSTTVPLDVVVQREQQLQRFQLLIVFADAGEIKHMAHDYHHLRLEVGQEVSASPPTYLVSIGCTPQELDGFILKIAQRPYIISVVRYE